MIKPSHANLIKLMNILNDSKYHDGSSLGKTLTITRSAIWKCIQKLIGYGIPIQSAKKKGYLLMEPVILLQRSLILKSLKELNIPIELDILETVGSTSDYVKTMPGKNPVKICIAEQQTQGRGRFARPWASPFGQNIYLSCLYRFHKDLSELAGLSLVIGLALVKTLNQLGINDVSLKWPNDIRWQQQKCGGVLIEISAESHGTCDAIIGIGLNVNMKQKQAVDQAWTSLTNILNKSIDRNSLVASLIIHLIQYIQQFEKNGLPYFTREWEKVDSLFNQTLTITMHHEEITGIASGINSQGHLLLKLADGTLRAISSGEATIKKPSRKSGTHA